MNRPIFKRPTFHGNIPTLQENAFADRTSSIHGGMNGRLKERKNKKGVIIRIGRRVPFTLEEFRVWVKREIGSGCTGCLYCGTPIDYINFVVDHRHPIARGGDLGLENLDLCCAECNNAKGNLTGSEFHALRVFLRGLGPMAETDVFRRLKAGAMGMRMRWFDRNKKKAPIDDNF
jgi:hypothetical protein